MLFNTLAASPALQVTTFTDVDAFRPLESMEDARSIPLDAMHFAAARAVTRLPACRIILMRSFARIMDNAYRAPGGMMIVSMTDDLHVNVNGASLDHRHFLALRGSCDGHIVETKANLHAMIIVSPDLPDRGWFFAPDKLQALAADRAALLHVRQLVLDILNMAAVEPELFGQAEIAENLQEGLLLALDDLFRGDPPSELTYSAMRERPVRLVRRIDDFLASNPTAPVYTADLASEFGVSMRTLGSAVAKVRGMSLHQYIRLTRLWATRCRLLRGGGGVTVASCARAHGFHHMGEFAMLYRAAFHEAPSETLARGR